MSRPAKLLAPLCAALLAGGCGGSSRSDTSAASPASSTTSTPASVAAQSGTTTSTSSSTTSTSSAYSAPHSARTSTTSASTATPRHDGGTAGSSGGRGTASGGPGKQYARLPATFTITAGGTLSPTAVSLPSVGSVALSIRSEDAQVRHVVLRMPVRSPALTVPAHGSASTVLHGIRPGRYVVDVDGLARGLVLIGGTPSTR